MFGIIYGLITLFGSGYEHLRRHKATRDGEKRGIELALKGKNRTMVYYDWQGRERDLYTGQKVVVQLSNGHEIVKVPGGKVLRDITAEQVDRECAIERNKPNGKKAIGLYNPMWLKSEWSKKFFEKPPYQDLAKDGVYKSVKNGKLCYRTRNDKKVREELEVITRELINVPYRVIIYGDFWYDLFSGEIIDKENEAFVYLIPTDTLQPPYYIWKHIEVKIKKETEQEIIEIYNNKVRNNQTFHLESEYSKLFKEEE